MHVGRSGFCFTPVGRSDRFHVRHLKSVQFFNNHLAFLVIANLTLNLISYILQVGNSFVLLCSHHRHDVFIVDFFYVGNFVYFALVVQPKDQ